MLSLLLPLGLLSTPSIRAGEHFQLLAYQCALQNMFNFGRRQFSAPIDLSITHNDINEAVMESSNCLSSIRLGVSSSDERFVPGRPSASMKVKLERGNRNGHQLSTAGKRTSLDKRESDACLSIELERRIRDRM